MNDILNNLYLHDKIPILHCSPSGASTFVQTRRFYIFFTFDRTMFWSKWKLSEMTLSTTLNFVINSLGFIVFTPRASEVDKIQPFCRKKSFFWSTLEAPRKNTVHTLFQFFKILFIDKFLFTNFIQVFNLCY